MGERPWKARMSGLTTSPMRISVARRRVSSLSQDVDAGAVSFRYRDGRQDNGVPIEEAIERVASAVASREQV